MMLNKTIYEIYSKELNKIIYMIYYKLINFKEIKFKWKETIK